MTTMIKGVLLDIPTQVRCRALKLNPASLLPNQLKDIREDALARYRLCGDFNGDPSITEESDYGN